VACRAGPPDDDGAELERLVNLDGGRQYRELLMAGELAEAVEQGVAKRSRPPAEVPEAEVDRWCEHVRSLLKARCCSPSRTTRNAGTTGTTRSTAGGPGRRCGS
jgi:hypothetical protein